MMGCSSIGRASGRNVSFCSGRSRMNKMAWFDKFEHFQAEHPDLPDEALSEMATESLIDDFADRADRINDERWIEEHIKGK